MTVIRKYVGWNLVNFIVTLVLQVVLPVHLIAVWGTNTYAEWLTITALISYVTLGDVGVSTFYSNKVVQEISREDEVTAQYTYTSFGVLFVTLSILLYSLYSLLGLNWILLVSYVFAHIFSSFANSFWRGISKMQVVLRIDIINRLLEFLVILILSRLSTDLFLIIKYFFFIKVILAFTKFLSLVILKRIKFRFRLNIIRRIKSDWKEFMALGVLPFIQISFTQLPILLLAKLNMAGSVVLYSTSRTLVNFGQSGSNILAQSYWPEITRQDAISTYRGKALITELMKYTVLVSAVYGIAILLFGNVIYKIWLNDEILYNMRLIIVLLLSSISWSLWNCYNLYFLSTNRQVRVINSIILVGSILVAVLSILFVVNYINIYIISIAVFMANLLLLIIISRKYHNV